MLPVSIYDDIKNINSRISAIERSGQFHLATDTFRFLETGSESAVISADMAEVVITYDFGFVPGHYAYANYAGRTYMFHNAGAMLLNPIYWVVAFASLTTLTMRAYFDAGHDGNTCNFRYYLFKEPAYMTELIKYGTGLKYGTGKKWGQIA